MPIRTILAALAATAALAACGGDPASNTSSDRQATARKALLDFARCMRAHGVPMRDPQFGSGGQVTMSAGGPGSPKVSPETQRAAERACDHYMKAVKPANVSPQQQAEFRRAALANARCMRAHGVPDFPDPQFGSNGEATLKIGKDSGIDPRSPAFQRAQKACAKYMPKMKVTG